MGLVSRLASLSMAMFSLVYRISTQPNVPGMREPGEQAGLSLSSAMFSLVYRILTLPNVPYSDPP